MSKNKEEYPMCDNYDEDTDTCYGYEMADRPGGWVERLPGLCLQFRSKEITCPYYKWFRSQTICAEVPPPNGPA